MNLTPEQADWVRARRAAGDAVIGLVVAGDWPRPHPHCVPVDPPGKNRRWRCQACGIVENGVPRGRCSAPDRDPCSWCGWVNTCAPDCPGVSVALSMADRLIGPTAHAAVADYVRRPQPLGPPADWVALTGACYCWDGMRLAPRDGMEPCPDCIDGRKRATLTAACAACEGVGGHWERDDARAEWGWVCEACNPDGDFDDVGHTTSTIPLAVATVEVVPVYLLHEHPTGDTWVAYDQDDDDAAVIRRGHPSTHQRIFLDRTPTPDVDFVVLLSNVLDA